LLLQGEGDEAYMKHNTGRKIQAMKKKGNERMRRKKGDLSST
jgi:hypothetical protein